MKFVYLQIYSFKKPIKDLRNRDPVIPVAENSVIPGFIRTGYHCYANSILQVVFNLEDINDHLDIDTTEDNNLRSLLRSYKSNCSTLDPAAVISDAGMNDAGINYTQNVYRNPMTFLIHLFDKYKMLGRSFGQSQAF